MKIKYDKTILLILITSAITMSLGAQAYQNLSLISADKLKVYASKGSEKTAGPVARRMDKVINYYYNLFDFTPSVTLLVLDSADWPKYTSFPVYGMPHYIDEKTLVVASQDNSFWNSLIPPLDKLPDELAEQIKKTYSYNGKLSMRAFFDLLAIHELGHAFHFQKNLNMQRKWMGEVFSNMMLHTYIAGNEPSLLPALSVFPEMIVVGGKQHYRFTSLADLEANYEEIATKHPQNYGWYQAKWHVAAGEIYDEGGIDVLKKLWIFQENKNEIQKDETFRAMLEDRVHPALGRLIAEWER